MNQKLSEADVIQELEGLAGWSCQAGKLHREVEFESFKQAFGFMTQAALLSEELNHHPEWFNVYNRVTIDLATHDAGGITQLDFKWARGVEHLLPNLA